MSLFYRHAQVASTNVGRQGRGRVLRGKGA